MSPWRGKLHGYALRTSFEFPSADINRTEYPSNAAAAESAPNSRSWRDPSRIKGGAQRPDDQHGQVPSMPPLRLRSSRRPPRSTPCGPAIDGGADCRRDELIRMSLLRRVQSCAMTPSSGSSSMSPTRPRVTSTEAFLGLRLGGAKALGRFLWNQPKLRMGMPIPMAQVAP